MKKLIIFLLLFTGSFSVVFASVNNAPIEEDTIISEIQKNNNIENKINYLENKVEVLNLINNKILNTVYWSLSVLISVFLAIIALNFFQNFTLNKKKVEKVEDELNGELENFNSILLLNKKELESKLENFNSILLLNKKELESSLNQNKIELKEFIREETDDYIKDLKKELKIDISKEVSIDIAKVERKIKKINDDIFTLNRHRLYLKAFEHKEKNQMGYPLNLLEILGLDIDNKYWDLKSSLDDIEIWVKSGGFRNNDALLKLNEVLSKLPENYDPIKNKILEEYNSKK